MAFFKKKITTNTQAVGKPEFIIAGLGNPGKEHELTHHNAGFLCLDVLCNKLGVRCDKVKWQALVTTANVNGHPCLLMRPQTYMNSSGNAIKQAADFYKIPPEKVIVLFDDIAIPFGTLRIRRNGSAGGHNGIKSIIYQLNSDQFPRIKLGIGERANADDDLKDYVLSKFSKAQCEELKKSFERAVCALELMVDGDTDGAMNKYNG